MRKEILKKVLDDAGVKYRTITDLGPTNINYITISKWENKFISTADNAFLFDEENELVEVYAVSRDRYGNILYDENGDIKYIKDPKTGFILFDIYTFSSIELISRTLTEEDENDA